MLEPYENYILIFKVKIFHLMHFFSKKMHSLTYDFNSKSRHCNFL